MIPPDNLARLSAAAMGRAFAAGQASPVALADYLLERIAQQTSPIFLAVTAERARSEARAAEARLRAGTPLSPLDGVPIAWKDLIDMQGERTTAGSQTRRDSAPARADATIVANAAAAGMVSLGKLNLTEFAYSGLGLNPHFGTPQNPHSRVARVPGGSSSGSGVAVALHLAPVAIGSDTGGSVRVPAAFNGIVGYKSSERRVSTDGVVALSRTLDTIGPLARCVEDCILTDMILRGCTTSPVRRRPVGAMRIFVPETIVFDDIEPAVADNFQASLDRLAAAGAEVAHGPCPAFDDAFRLSATLGSITAGESFVEHQALFNSPDRARVDHRVVSRVEGGRAMPAPNYIALLRARQQAMAVLRAQLDGRLMAMPTVPVTAPEIAPLEAEDAQFDRANSLALRNTSLGNYHNMPGVALPNGTDDNGLPTSFLLSACGDEDDVLLGHALTGEPVIRGAAD